MLLRQEDPQSNLDLSDKPLKLRYFMKHHALFLVVILILSACARQPVYRTSDTPLQTVNEVDLEKYLGRWYEIGRLPNSFETDCEGVTADYSKRADGLIRVINSCRLNSVSGDLKVAEGRAKITDTVTNAKLKVSFFGPFWGDYWIMHLAEDYSLSIVGEPSGKYLWILSRTPTLDQTTKDEALSFVAEQGYPVDALYFPKQPATPENPVPN